MDRTVPLHGAFHSRLLISASGCGLLFVLFAGSGRAQSACIYSFILGDITEASALRFHVSPRMAGNVETNIGFPQPTTRVITLSIA
ncbi:MAG TPA: hypothetical protein VKV15_13430 [Bryobacteraceae bacterium]|nr:hypothetical protein [Bryobacteraceae bacterium]